MIEAPTITPPDAAMPRGKALRRGLAANPLLTVGGALVLLIVLVAIVAPLIVPFPGDAGTATHPFEVLKAPSAANWFVTDNVGRDIVSRVLFGARVSPVIAIIVLIIESLLGIQLRVDAGFLGSRHAEMIKRLTL